MTSSDVWATILPRGPDLRPAPLQAALPGLVTDVQDKGLQAGARTASSALARDGTRLVYELQGTKRSGQDHAVDGIALVHSLAMDLSFWQPVVERLAPVAPVLVYDCRGHGESDKPAGPYTVELFARDLADLLDHVGWGSALVAGASMGGCVALAFAAAYPARTAALGLIDTTAWYGADAPQQWAERSSRAATQGLSALVEFQSTRWFGDAFRAQRPDVVQRCVEVFLRNAVPAYVETCKMLGSADVRAALPAMTMPAAIVVGEEDYATPVAMAEALQRGIEGSTLTVLKGARHLTPLEAPGSIADELSALMKRVDNRNARS